MEDYDSEDGDECDFDEQRANADHGSIEVSDRDIKKVQRAAERLVSLFQSPLFYDISSDFLHENVIKR